MYNVFSKVSELKYECLYNQIDYMGTIPRVSSQLLQ